MRSIGGEVRLDREMNRPSSIFTQSARNPFSERESIHFSGESRPLGSPSPNAHWAIAAVTIAEGANSVGSTMKALPSAARVSPRALIASEGSSMV